MITASPSSGKSPLISIVIASLCSYVVYAKSGAAYLFPVPIVLLISYAP